MRKKIENLSKLIPICYPLLIFLGFYNYLSYYRFFDIEIFPYLTIYELLFSIISKITPIFITGFLIICYVIFMVILPLSKKEKRTKKPTKKSESEIEIDPKFERLRRFKKRQVSTSFIYNNYHDLTLKRGILFYKKFFFFKEYNKAFSHLFLFLFNIIGVLFKIGLWIFFFVFTCAGMLIIFSPLQYDLNYYSPFFINNTSTIISILIWCALIYAMISRTKENNPKSSVRTMQSIPLVFLIFLFMTIYQKEKAEKTLNHATYDVNFQYDGRNIKSTSKKVFVGKTTDYIFLRDLDKQKNFIYPISDVKSLEITKISQ
ncbi:hypothetical protein J0871_04285 [Salegentibacter sp. BDJ18]|uniref:hypothetical protein n=1 Tax=Salegentibacter sp. BDJ18 TaxID=2816376 RepID=UPI001AAE5DF9|nr:hypothetical protein [Salegentibacter sp. BDJ18]MBO2543626.1 hypothetical protein [Salegentibacter sp. BDJ18]